MRIARLLWTIGRLAAAGAAYLACLAVSYGLLFYGAPSGPAASGEPLSPGLALPLVAGLETAIVGLLILRSRWSGWRLVGTLIPAFFAVQTLLPQSESLIFQAFPAFAGHVPAGMVPRILAAGLLHACLWIPVAVRLLKGWNPEAPPEGPGLRAMALSEWSPKLLLSAAAYVALYFTFGYYIAWRSPAVRAYYGGADPGTLLEQILSVARETPWLPPIQALRGLVWTGAGLLLLRALRGSVAEKALLVGAFFAVVMSAGLLLPNPFMPFDVRMIHLVETASSDFILGVLVVWMFGAGSAP